MSGDIGPGIEPGRDKRIVWSIGQEYPKGYTGPVMYEVQTRAEREQGAELAVCEAHFAANRLTTGVGGNAASCYAELLQREPGNLAAVRGLDTVTAKYRSWAEWAIAAGTTNGRGTGGKSASGGSQGGPSRAGSREKSRPSEAATPATRSGAGQNAPGQIVGRGGPAQAPAGGNIGQDGD